MPVHVPKAQEEAVLSQGGAIVSGLHPGQSPQWTHREEHLGNRFCQSAQWENYHCAMVKGGPSLQPLPLSTPHPASPLWSSAGVIFEEKLSQFCSPTNVHPPESYTMNPLYPLHMCRRRPAPHTTGPNIDLDLKGLVQRGSGDVLRSGVWSTEPLMKGREGVRGWGLYAPAV